MVVYCCGLYPCEFKKNNSPCIFTEGLSYLGKVDTVYISSVRNVDCNKDLEDIFGSLYIDADYQE